MKVVDLAKIWMVRQVDLNNTLTASGTYRALAAGAARDKFNKGKSDLFHLKV